MEIRWCWAAFILLTVVSHTAVTHSSDSSSSTVVSDSRGNISSRHSSSNKSSSSVKASDDVPKSDLGRSTVSDAKQEIESDNNLDEIIASTEAIAAKSAKKYFKKENKVHRKKYMPNMKQPPAAAGEQQPLIREPRESQQHNEGEDDTSSSPKFVGSESERPHSRKKRLIWVTDDGRLALPPGTSLTIAPTIALPFVRYPPTGFLSNISISLPVTIDFDKLGLTDNQNPLGVLPPLFARSMGRAAGSILADYVSDYMHTRRRKRSSSSTSSNSGNFKMTTNFIDGEEDELKTPELPQEHKHAFHGGERALLYTVVEDFIANFGVDGKACILRAICEVHSKPVENFGLIGEILKLFFTASLSPYSEHLDEYVSAENIGKGKAEPGECFPYYKECPKSLFRMSNNFKQHYKHELAEETVEDELYNNNLDDIEREIRSTGKSSSYLKSKDETVIQLDDVNKMAM